jgi:hypothetical protein
VTQLPEYVYLVTVDTEWPVSVIADDNPALTADRVAKEVERRHGSGNVSRPEQVHVWRAQLADVQEVDLMPATVVRASLRERTT